VFGVIGDSMVDRTTEPFIMPGIAYSLILSDRPQAATEALDIAVERGDPERFSYWRAWTRWAAGDTAGAIADLRRLGFMNVQRLARGRRGERPASSLEGEDALVAARYSAPLAADVHGRLAAIWLASAATRQDGVIEAYAFKALVPDDPEAWKVWTNALLAESQPEAAIPSLKTYLRLLASRSESDPEAERLLQELEGATRGRTTRAALHPGS